MRTPDAPRQAGPFVVRPMRVADISQVSAIEQEAFTTPWPAYAYHHELTNNDLSHYFVLARASTPTSRSWWNRWRTMWNSSDVASEAEILGYGGFWMTSWAESHISTIAVKALWRGHGLGELLLYVMVERSSELGARQVTLEVRVSNTVAQNLYRKYGFEVTGVHPRYYRDNDEDAYLMTVPSVDAAYRARLQHLGRQLIQRLESGREEPGGGG